MKVSPLCLGCMTYGSPSWRPWVLDAEGAAPIFRRAIESGINFFDTADIYSIGESEEVTGQLLREYGKRDELVIASKVYFPMNDRPNMGGLSRKHIQQSCEDSLRRLGVDVIDLYQIHRLDPRTPIHETLRALDDLVRQGKVRAIGTSSIFAWELMRSLAISDREGLARFATMQNHYNLVYREEEREMMPLCELEGVGVIPWSPLARGMLAGTRQKLGDTSTTRSETDGLDQILYDQPSDWDVVEAVRDVAKQRGVNPAQVALAWVRSRRAVVAPIIGATKVAHLEDALSSLSLDLEDAEVAALEAPYAPHPVKGMSPKPSMRF
jgi:aryl-alcohol dehydrogenase-like predicted oxidoreductase